MKFLEHTYTRFQTIHITFEIILFGIIALCPVLTGDENTDTVAKVAVMVIRVVILEGSLSGKIEDQDNLIKMFNEAGFKYTFIINSCIGHQIPINMNKKIDLALDFICK